MITEYEFEHLNAIVYLIICGSIIHFHLLQISYQNITINLIGNELQKEILDPILSLMLIYFIKAMYSIEHHINTKIN